MNPDLTLFSATKSFHHRAGSPSGQGSPPVLVAIFLCITCGLLGFFLWTPTDPTPLGNSTRPIFEESNAENVPTKSKEATEEATEEAKQASQKLQNSSPLAPLSETFPVITKFSGLDIGRYQKIYRDVHMGWTPTRADQAEEARRRTNHLGPLGIEVLPHIPQNQNRPAFAAIVPEALRTQDGKLGLIAAEVVSIAPGSPAEGHLQIGDLIVGIEDEWLKSGNQYRPGWDFMHKDARGIQLMLGEKIDAAQGRGDIRLTVLRFPEGESQALPIGRRELWSGTGGNQSTGIQNFDVELPSEGTVTLVTDKFDGPIHGDGSVWLDVTIEDGTQYQQLFALNPIALQAGYGSATISLDKPFGHRGETFQGVLNLHAHGIAQWKLPKGMRRIKGSFAALSYGKVQPKIFFTPDALPLSGSHREHLIDLRFPIGKTGSFSQHYPKNCAKTELLTRRHTEWLASHQRKDGSWPRLRGYTGDGWDTSWCALALMSSGESKYDEQIRRAAYRVAYQTAPSEWTAERSMRLIFLSEYYLRTRDEKIVAGIQAAYHQVLDCCKTDFMAGHKVNGFGYGIAGQHYGTGHLVLAIALASRTPITTQPELVNGIIRHAGEVCVNGTYAYGRGRRMARNESRKHSGGNAMSGPAVLGIQIGGGHASAIREHTERIAASIGDGDNSHATSSLAFIFSSLAIAAADETVFLEHMRNFRYKMTLDDNWEGGFLKSVFRLDFQGGEGVTSNWIRTAGYLLVLNATKHQLAITGKREFWHDEYLTDIPASEWGTQIHSYYLRNWCLVHELLGAQAPTELPSLIKTLAQLPRNSKLVPQTREMVEANAPSMISNLAANQSLDARQRAYAIELLCGLDFRLFTSKSGDKQKIDLHVNLPLQQLNWLDEDKSHLFEQSPLPLQSKVEIVGAQLTAPVVFETEGTQNFDLDQGTRHLSTTVSLKDPAALEFNGLARIFFKLGKYSVSYTRPLKFNTEYQHSNHYNLRRLKLKLKVAPRAYFQSQPLIIAGIPFDCMYPQERMPEMEGPTPETEVHPHEGDSIWVDLASENFICAWVYRFKFQSQSQVDTFAPRDLRPIRGELRGKVEDLYDFVGTSTCQVHPQQSKSILEFDFGKTVNLNGLDARFGGSLFMRIWYQRGDQWIPLVWDNYSTGTSHHPNFPETEARRWRVEFQHGRPFDLSTLRFYHNPHRHFPYAPLAQSRQSQFLPPIQPE